MKVHCVRMVARMLPVICMFAAAALGGEDKERSLWKQLDGEWEIVEVQRNGKTTKEASVKPGDRVRFKSGKMAAINAVTNGVAYELNVALEQKQSPVGIKLTSLEGDVVVDFAGIVEVDGDRLRVCKGVRGYSATPTEFRTQPKDGLILIVYQRRSKKADREERENRADQGSGLIDE